MTEADLKALPVFSFSQRLLITEPSGTERKHFSRLSEEEVQNLIEVKDSENTRKAIKNAAVTLLAYWNEVKLEDEQVKKYRIARKNSEEGTE